MIPMEFCRVVYKHDYILDKSTVLPYALPMSTKPTSSSTYGQNQTPESDAVNPSLSMPIGSASEPSAVSPVSSSRPRKSPKPKGLNLATLVSRYGTSEKCRELLCRVRR